jgi:rare lipoprotein A
LASIPDAVPKAEPLHRFANRPYMALGMNFTPLDGDQDYRASGLASWYGRRFHGKPTASGEVYDMYAMTAAHATLPIPSYARVSNPSNGKSVIVRINDRGPFHADRLIDLSYTAAWKLGILAGVSNVEVEKVSADDAPSQAIKTSLTAPPEPGIYLQLAALTSAGAADDFYRRILEKQANLRFPGLQRIASGDFIKIQAGPYSTVPVAEAAAAVIEQELGLRPYRIVR